MNKRSSSPPTIAFYDHTAKLSGGEISLLHLVSRLDRKKYKALVILGEEGRLKDELTAAGVETLVLPLGRSIADTRKDTLQGGGLAKATAGLEVFRYIFKLRRLLRRRQVAFLHTNSLKSDLIGGIAGRLAFIPVIWHLRDIIETDYLPGAAVKIVRLAARILPTHVISISQAVRESLKLPATKPQTVVYNGIVPEAIPAPSEISWEVPPRIAMVGRITRWKGQHVFIKAAAIVRQSHPEASFQIIGSAMFGETDYENELHSLVDELGMQRNVEFTGQREDVARLIQDVHVIVHASITAEPFGKVVVEGMLAGRPVVATAGGGVPEIIEDGQTGLLVPMGDPAAMAEAINRVLGDPQFAEIMGKKARDAALHSFPISRTVSAVEQVFDEILLKS